MEKFLDGYNLVTIGLFGLPSKKKRVSGMSANPLLRFRFSGAGGRNRTDMVLSTTGF
jgi:hypothetical protein